MDVAASVVWPEVVYVDIDDRAARFFRDAAAVDDLVAELGAPSGDRVWSFHHVDYRDPLPLEPNAVDLLISLSAGFVSEACGDHLRPGGALLVNSSHGDAELARHDPRLALTGIVLRHGDGYRVASDSLDEFMVPKDPEAATPEKVRETGRGVAYTRAAVAYVFMRTG